MRSRSGTQPYSRCSVTKVTDADELLPVDREDASIDTALLTTPPTMKRPSRTHLSALLIAALLVTVGSVGAALGPSSTVAPTGSVSADSDILNASSAGPSTVEGTAKRATSAGDRVVLSPGHQLSIVADGRRTAVDSGVSETAFDVRLERNATEPAVRLRTLTVQFDALQDEYESLLTRYRAGELTPRAFVAGVVRLELRRQALETSLNRFRDKRAGDSTTRAEADRLLAEVQAARSPVAASLVAGANGDDLTGSYVATIASADGAVELSARTGDGERRVERQFGAGDDSTAITVDEDVAVAAARAALTVEAEWQSTEVDRDESDGTYRIRLEAPEAEARIVVDGSSGAVLETEERVEDIASDREDDRAAVESKGEITLTFADPVVRGTTVTLRATLDGEPVADAPVEVNGSLVGRTDAEGTLELAVPHGDEFRVRLETDDHRGEVRYRWG